MLPFEEQILSDLLEDPHGGLVVVSAGLPLHSIAASLLIVHHSSSGSILFLSASDSQKSSVLQSLQRLQDPNPNPNLPSELAGDLPGNQRAALYSSGAAFFVTARVLIADLLFPRAPPGSISSLIILNAHRLSDTSPEAFIARLLRRHSPRASVVAFSDRPLPLSSGFSKPERILKSLYIKKLHLWPRFHVLVSADLEKDPPEVVDVRVPMTAAMKGVQSAALEAMGACLRELRRTNKVDVDDLTVENGLFKSFDEIVRQQLDPIWHTLGKKTKQLVNDLKTLRKLVDYLVRYDAVTFLKYLDTLRVSEGGKSIWIYAESSYKIFEFAKKRVYHVLRADGSKISMNSKSAANKKRRVNDDNNKNRENEASCSDGGKGHINSGVMLEEVLEEAPKWKVLRELLEEIEEERRKVALSREDELGIEDTGEDTGIVMVACKDERSCLQLEACITKGPHQVMREEWGKYLLGKAELHGLQKRSKKKNQEPKGFGILNGEVANGPYENTDPSSISKLENDALLAAASEISHLASEEISVGDGSDPCATRGRSRKCRGRGRGRSKKASSKGQTPINRHKNPGDDKVIGKGCSAIEIQGAEKDTEDATDLEERSLLDASTDKAVLRRHSKDHDISESVCAKPLPPVQFYALESDKHILDVWKPSAIVVYHPDIAFVREIEVYKAENPSRKLKVYFLFYEDSTEVQKFEASIRRENAAFESLIRQKSLMMIPVDQDGRCIGLKSSSEPDLHGLQNSQTRKAGGRKTVEKEMQVIVDMREFMSSLPNVLHQKGMRIIPVTLEVGDYVLSPMICVERKSITDLFQSFASGRLYHQVETMSANDISDDVSPTSIISKLSLLVLHFPRLRLVWSRSVHATAEIFASLKMNQDEPDETKAIRVGVPSEDGVIENDVRAENYNTSAVEFLRRLPGVTDSNYRALMDGCNSLAELALLPIERLAELMGGQKLARTLKDFLDAKFPTLL
ncbi:DNA repair endonuclease UVH1 isoform X2 [Dioscorea cayenensis subsp. rotundata]|uniref:DNA repair endonuclease UVH1 isoform X2 n=1 Tax=Dioscorea cayennensis subsp. rotundata TaxID=55577 RepID=A0AB40CMS3_DIOCR|nr:DNA repair endonuclease UVH1 isoform X2 [Dioscorea cayenensis subsp. rotundata]